MLKNALMVALAGLALSGCGRQLYHYHRTIIGLDIAGNVNGNTPSGHLVLGYSRRLVVAFPNDKLEPQSTQNQGQDLKAQDLKGQNSKGQDRESLPSTVFCTQVKGSLGGLSLFREILATGYSADAYASLMASEGSESSRPSRANFVCPDMEIPKPRGGSTEGAVTDQSDSKPATPSKPASQGAK